MTKGIKALYTKAGLTPPKGKGIHTTAFHKCVVSCAKGQGGVIEGKVNCNAVCMSSIGRTKAVKKSHRRKKGGKPRMTMKVLEMLQNPGDAIEETLEVVSMEESVYLDLPGSYEELGQKLGVQLKAQFPQFYKQIKRKGKVVGNHYCRIIGTFDDRVVIKVTEDTPGMYDAVKSYHQIPYTVDAAGVKFGKPVKVELSSVNVREVK